MNRIVLEELLKGYAHHALGMALTGWPIEGVKVTVENAAGAVVLEFIPALADGAAAIPAPRKGRPIGPCAVEIIAFLRPGPRHYTEITEGVAQPERTVAATLKKLVEAGIVLHPGEGEPYSLG